MPLRGKKVKGKQKSKSEPENDGCTYNVENPQSGTIMQRMASKTLSSGTRKLESDRKQVETSQSSLWLSKTKFSVEDLLDSDNQTFGRLMNGEVRSDVFESLTLEEVKDLKLVFDAFDSDCTGSIEFVELQRILYSLGFRIPEESLKKITGRFDLEESGKIDFNDFLDVVISKQGSDRDVHSEIMQGRFSLGGGEISLSEKRNEGFNLIDTDKTGKISLDNLRNVCRDNHVKLSDQELKDMIQEADTDGDGQVNASEFVQIMQKTNLF